VKKIFVSYSRADGGDFADHVQEHYEKDGHQVFVDLSDIKPGEDWSESIQNSIADSDIVVVIVTRSALKSSEVEKEILEARKQNKIIIPCRYRGISWTDLKWDLNKLQGFEFDNKNSLIRQLDEIIFSENRSAVLSSPLPEDEGGGKAASRYILSSKRSKRIIAIISSTAIIAFVIGIVVFTQQPSPISSNDVGNQTKEQNKMTPDIDTLFSTAFSFYKMAQYSDAVDSFNKVLQIEPNNVTAQFLKGSSLYKEGKYQDAVDSFNKVLQIEPNNVTAQFLKGSSLYKEGKYQDAVDSFNKVIEIKPNNTNALLYNGKSLYNLERYNDAISQFNKLLAVQSSNTDALLYKGLSLYNLERYNEAIAQFNRLLAVEPTNIDALLYKGLSLYNLERYNEAGAYFDRVLEIDPNNINATKQKDKIQQIQQQNQSNTNSSRNN
jgi:tetratricopeptide (TPR) repeat protein